MSDELSISADIYQRGDKWYITIRATDCEDEHYEYDTEEQARAAFVAARELVQRRQDEGQIGRIVDRKR